MVTLRQIELYLRLDDLHAKTIFMVVEKLLVNISIGGCLMGRYNISFYPTEREIKPFCSRLLPILLKGASGKLP